MLEFCSLIYLNLRHMRESTGSYFAFLCQVHLGKDRSRTFALKKMKKKFIVDMKQQQHVMQEKKLLMAVRCPFIVRSPYTVVDSTMDY